jgi:TonB family protein
MATSKKDKHFIHKPEYPGGPKAMTDFIYKNLRYPPEAVADNVEGIVLVDYDIDHKGHVVETRVLQGIGHGCDEEACRVVKMLRFEVRKNRGLNVLFHQKARIQFKKPQPIEQPQPTVILPAPQPGQQVTYTINFTPATPATEQPEQPANTYTYTIQIGG